MQKAVLITIAILLGISNQSFSQLALYKVNGVEMMGSVEAFLEKNNFEYAVVSYSSGSRSYSKTFTGLAKQNGLWYLFRISGQSYYQPAFSELRVRPVIRQKILSASEIDSVMQIVRPGDGMKYSQQELYTLPKSCEVNFRGRKATFGSLSDANTYYLAERKADKVVSLSFYGADTYLHNCLPLNPEFKILIGVVNTVKKLDSIAESLIVGVTD